MLSNSNALGTFVDTFAEGSVDCPPTMSPSVPPRGVGKPLDGSDNESCRTKVVAYIVSTFKTHWSQKPVTQELQAPSEPPKSKHSSTTPRLEQTRETLALVPKDRRSNETS